MTGTLGAVAEALLVYDGECGVCSACADWAVARAAGPLRAEPFQQLGAGGLAAAGLTEAQARAAAWWVVPGRAPRGGAAAVAAALRALRRPWSWLGLVLSVPPASWLAARLYPVVARNRYRLAVPGRGGARCAVPPAARR